MTLSHHLQNGQLTDTALNSVSTNQKKIGVKCNIDSLPF